MEEVAYENGSHRKDTAYQKEGQKYNGPLGGYRSIAGIGLRHNFGLGCHCCLGKGGFFAFLKQEYKEVVLNLLLTQNVFIFALHRRDILDAGVGYCILPVEVAQRNFGSMTHVRQ